MDYLLTFEPAKIAAAISGGADSMCLARLLSQWCSKSKIEFTALIVDHGLRDESAKEALWVQSFLEHRGIKTIILKWDGIKPKADIQNKARIARYNLLVEYCKNHNIKHLFVAHTLNDQAETVLMRVIRGTGIDGISGIKAKSAYDGITLLRPLLNTSRAQIEEHLLLNEWSWVNDPSNLNHKYDRIKVRSMLASYAYQFGDDMLYKRLSLLADNARRAKNYINKRVDIVWSKYVTVDPFNFLIIDNALYKLHEELKLRLFVRIFKYLRPDLPAPRLSSLFDLISAFKDAHKLTKTLMGCIVIKDLRRTAVVLEVGKKPLELKLKVGEVNVWHNLKITVSKDGLTARALGRDGWRYMRTLNYLKPKGVPINAINSMLAIYAGDKLVCAPHMEFKDCEIEVVVSYV